MAAMPVTARQTPVSTNFTSGTLTARRLHHSNHSRVASEAQGVMTGPTFVPMSSESSWSWFPGGTTRSPA